MHTLMRRVALGLTLPLAVGAPVVLLPDAAHAVVDTIVVSTSEEASVYGQLITAKAEVLDGTTPVTVGSVRFQIGLTGHEPTMDVTVPLGATGEATTPPLTQGNGLPLDINEYPDSWNVHVIYYDGAEQPTSLFDDTYFDVTKAQSSIAVLSTASQLVADINGQTPGGVLETSIRPTGGAVHFKVDGVDVGTNDAVNGKATLNYVVAPGSHTLAVSYTGDDRYLASAATSSRSDPTISARVLPMLPRSKSGWYHSVVDIWFICKPQGSELVEDCPGDISLTKSGKNQTVTRTIHAVDGGLATVTVSDIDIDRDKPVITVEGRSCSATDKLSGVKGKCHLHVSPNGSYRAVAIDKAGNRAVKRGTLD